MKYFFIVVVALIGLVALTFFFDAMGIAEVKIFGVKKENARREVFEQTQSYVDGKRQDLLRWKLQYETEKDTVARKALRYTILHSMVGLDESTLSPSLQTFLQEIR